MKKIILIILMTILAGCSGLTVKATYQYPAPVTK